LFRKILIPLDGSKLAENVFPYLQLIANSSETKEVVLVHVIKSIWLLGPPEFNTSRIFSNIMFVEKQDIENYFRRIIPTINLCNATVTSLILYGNVASQIINFTLNNNFDLIILAPRIRSRLNKWLSFSVSNAILHEVNIPVLLIRQAKRNK
jgi:nucleotide-binding universal stress UspA family protein